jgi:hypothetical protein
VPRRNWYILGAVALLLLAYGCLGGDSDAPPATTTAPPPATTR